MTTTRHLIKITDTGAAEITSLFSKVDTGSLTSPVMVRIYNNDPLGTAATSSNHLHAIRADMLREDPPGEALMDTQRAGGEIISECWPEARINGIGAWEPLDEITHYLDLGPIAAQSYVTVELRLNPPSSAATFGDADFNLLVRSR